MITIVMAYFDRQIQLIKTLESFMQYNPKSFRVVIIDDCSPIDIILPKYSFDVTVLKISNKTWTNPAPAYNTGIIHALIKNPEIIILQNAECYHAGDILSYAKKITDDSYISFGCYSLGQNETPEAHAFNDRHQIFDGDSAWYNHPIYNTRGLNFCVAITNKNLIKLNGFDERFKDGCSYDDDYFLHQIKLLGLKIEITSEPFVFHQWHPRVYYTNLAELIEKNRILYEDLIKENNYKAKHILTLNLDGNS